MAVLLFVLIIVVLLVAFCASANEDRKTNELWKDLDEDEDS